MLDSPREKEGNIEQLNKACNNAVGRSGDSFHKQRNEHQCKGIIDDSPTKSLFRPPDFNFKYLFRKNDHQRRTFGICDNSERFFFNFIETFVYFIFQLFPR